MEPLFPTLPTDEAPPRPATAIGVVVLCGGRGSRLSPLTDTLPKGMAPVNGRPMLEHLLAFYQGHRLTRFTLCIGYLGEVIRHHFADHPLASVQFSDAGPTAGMLQRLWEARTLTTETFLVVYGDTFIDLDPHRLLAHHRRADASLTIVTAAIRNPFGVVQSSPGGWVESFAEKPLCNCYIGCLVMGPRAFAQVTPAMLAAPDGEGLVALFQTLIAQRQLAEYPHDGLQINFNTAPEHRQAEAAMMKYYTCRETP